MLSGIRHGCRTGATIVVWLALARAAHADCFEHHAARFGLDPNLLRAIADVESGGRPQAVNRSHLGRTGTTDVGLMQINTGWLPHLARHGIAASDLQDPCTSIEIGAWILHGLVQRMGNTWEAVGAYNAACSSLKGTACTQARSDYAWRVFRRLSARASGAAAAAAAARPRVAPAPVSGLVSLQLDASTSPADGLEEPRS